MRARIHSVCGKSVYQWNTVPVAQTGLCGREQTAARLSQGHAGGSRQGRTIDQDDAHRHLFQHLAHTPLGAEAVKIGFPALGLYVACMRLKPDIEHPRAVDIALLILRLGAGSMMLFAHGWGKLTGFAEKAAKFSDPLGVSPPISMGLSVFAEVFCSLALMLGLYTRLSAAPLFITMLVAGLLVHGDDPWKTKEKAFLFLLMFLVLMIAGGGRYSLSRLIPRLVSRFTRKPGPPR